MRLRVRPPVRPAALAQVSGTASLTRTAARASDHSPQSRRQQPASAGGGAVAVAAAAAPHHAPAAAAAVRCCDDYDGYPMVVLYGLRLAPSFAVVQLHRWCAPGAGLEQPKACEQDMGFSRQADRQAATPTGRRAAGRAGGRLGGRAGWLAGRAGRQAGRQAGKQAGALGQRSRQWQTCGHVARRACWLGSKQ